MVIGQIADCVGEADHLDFENRPLFGVIEHSAIRDFGFGSQLVAPEDKIEAEVVRQNRLRRDRAPEDHADISLGFRGRRSAAGPRLRRCIGLVEGRNRLAVLDRDRPHAAFGIGQHDEQSLPRTTRKRNIEASAGIVRRVINDRHRLEPQTWCRAPPGLRSGS